ncbi:MAG: gamma carbonic anhydrase family protein [Eubacterium sp.]
MTGKNIFIAKSADVLGKVKIGNYSSVWYQAVLRGDTGTITIGERSNVQDGSIVHVAPGHNTKIGSGVTVGHNCIIHGCTVGDDVLVGMGSIILNGAVIGENTIIGAGTLVTQNKVIPPNSLVVGSPGKVVRQLTDQEVDSIRENAQEYMDSMGLESGKSYYEDGDGIIIVRGL